MFSTKLNLILRFNRLCFNRRISSVCNELIQINEYKTVEYEKKSPKSVLIGLRHYSDQKANKKPVLKVEFVDDTPRLTHTERLKRVIQNYGTTALVLHISLSLTSLGIWYTIVYMGVDLPSHFDFDRFGAIGAKVMASSGTFAVAYAIHKMTMPVRVMATVALTPLVVKWLREKGFIKKPHKHL